MHLPFTCRILSFETCEFALRGNGLLARTVTGTLASFTLPFLLFQARFDGGYIHADGPNGGLEHLS